jgi:hypothetical protein
LNQITRDEAAPLPRTQEVLCDFGTAQVYSSMDLKSGYWQIPMDPISKHLTTFATSDGTLYQYRVMPFGLKNVPATFQKPMTRVLAGLLGKCVHVTDDIIVYSRTHEEHVSHLRQVFERLHEYGLRCAVEKCRFEVCELPYLGHVIGSKCNRPQEGHLRQIRDAPTPRIKKQLQSFLGLANWVREYVPRFSEIAAPLTDLLHKGKSFKRTTAAEEALLNLKEALDRPLVLHRPDPDLGFTSDRRERRGYHRLPVPGERITTPYHILRHRPPECQQTGISLHRMRREKVLAVLGGEAVCPEVR